MAHWQAPIRTDTACCKTPCQIRCRDTQPSAAIPQLSIASRLQKGSDGVVPSEPEISRRPRRQRAWRRLTRLRTWRMLQVPRSLGNLVSVPRLINGGTQPAQPYEHYNKSFLATYTAQSASWLRLLA